jgi:hypothetical protein
MGQAPWPKLPASAVGGQRRVEHLRLSQQLGEAGGFPDRIFETTGL